VARTRTETRAFTGVPPSIRLASWMCGAHARPRECHSITGPRSSVEAPEGTSQQPQGSHAGVMRKPPLRPGCATRPIPPTSTHSQSAGTGPAASSIRPPPRGCPGSGPRAHGRRCQRPRSKQGRSKGSTAPPAKALAGDAPEKSPGNLRSRAEGREPPAPTRVRHENNPAASIPGNARIHLLAPGIDPAAQIDGP